MSEKRAGRDRGEARDRATLYEWRIELNGFAVVGASLAGGIDQEYPFEGREGLPACSLKGGDVDDTAALEND